MRAAAVQLHSTEDRDHNLQVAECLVRDAAGAGAELVVLPEKFNLMGSASQWQQGAEPLDGITISWAAELARDLNIWLLAGSIVERKEDGKLANTSVLMGPDGKNAAVYRKIHMFDVEVGGVPYRESDLEEAGDEIVVSDAAGIQVGMSICYDLRFPELYRILALKGAKVVCIPSAFTAHTGKDHWETLIKARAVENQTFIVAADQIGPCPSKHDSYGRSMIVDPWGTVLEVAADRETFIVADLDLDRQEEIRRELPSLENRRPEVYEWPAGSAA